MQVGYTNAANSYAINSQYQLIASMELTAIQLTLPYFEAWRFQNNSVCSHIEKYVR